jgi:hypothetical protein
MLAGALRNADIRLLQDRPIAFLVQNKRAELVYGLNRARSNFRS